MANKRLERTSDKKIGGVCGGVANYIGTDPTIIRIIWLVMVFGLGFGVVLYLALWILMPQGGKCSYEERMHARLRKGRE